MTVDAPTRPFTERSLAAIALRPPVIRQVVIHSVEALVKTPTRTVITGWVSLLLVFAVSLAICLSPKLPRTVQEIPIAGPATLAQTGVTPDQLPLLVTANNDATGTVLEAWLTGSESQGYSVLDAKSYKRHGRHSGSHKKPLPSKIVHLNTATLAQLQTLPGVGPKMAMRILALRKALGGQFTRVDQLLDVKGIGPKTFAKLARFCQL